MLLAGCGSTRDARAPQLVTEPPAQFAASVSAPAGSPLATAKTWSFLGDPLLEELIAEALANNPNLNALRATVEQALAGARIEGAALSPQVSAGLNGARRKQNFIGFPIPGGEDGVLSSTSTSVGLSLNVSWEADLWGRLRAGKAAAWADADAARADLAAAHLSLAAQTAKSWFALIEASRQVQLAERELTSRGDSETSVGRRYERGLVSSLEIRLARTQTQIVASQLAERQRQLDALTRQLEVLLGRYPGAELSAANDLPPAPPLFGPGLPADVIARRPDLAASERRALAASARLRAADRARYPSLSLTGSTGTASNELSDLLDGDFSVWSLAAGLLQPVFQGGRLRAARDVADAGLEVAEQRWLEATLSAYLEVESALAAEGYLDDLVTALASATSESRAAEELASERYRNGLLDYLGLLESQRTAFQSASQLLTAQRQRLDARVDLLLALGGPTDFLPNDAELLEASAPSLGSNESSRE